jgi:hypothetical protein
MFVNLTRRVSQLHIQSLIMGIAALPGFAVAKQVAVVRAHDFGAVIATVTIVEFIFGARKWVL